MKLVTILICAVSLHYAGASTIRSGFFWANGLELQYPAKFGTEQEIGYTIKSSIYKSVHPLLKDNEVAVSLVTALSPVTLTEKLSIAITPVAFWKIGGSLLTGFGWYAFNSCGTGINDHAGRNYRSGLVYKANLWSQLQIETKGIFKNDLLNFQVAAIETITKSSFSGAHENESWIFQDDQGENFNGWSWNQLFFSGYEYPVSEYRKLITGVLLGTQRYLTTYNLSLIDNGGWGSDFVFVTVSPVISFQYSRNLEMVLLCKFRSYRLYDDNNKKVHFMSKRYEGAEMRYDRVQLQMKYSFGRREWVPGKN
jgi:hypothetical protein